jgi:beta-glucosidase
MYRYQDSSLSPSERAQDLLGRMSLEEKIDQLGCAFFQGWGMPDLEKELPYALGTVGAMSLTHSVEELGGILRSAQEHIMKKSPHGIPALFHVEAISGGLFVEATSFPSAITQASSVRSGARTVSVVPIP